MGSSSGECGVRVAQGINPDRRLEHLGESDKGIILYRKLLEEQVAVVQDGGDPLGTIRDPKKNERLSTPQEGWRPMRPDMSPNNVTPPRSKLKDQILQLLAEARESAATDASSSERQRPSSAVKR